MNLKASSLLLVYLGLLGCTSASVSDTRANTNPEPDTAALTQEIKDEVTVGRAMAAKLLGSFGYYENEKAQSYTNLVGQSISRKFGRRELIYYFGVLDSDEVNAFATPGGYVFLTRGLYSKLKNESELAACLAHEISHINEKHMYDVIKPKREISAGETIARMLSRGGSDLGGSLSQIVNQGLDMLLKTGLGKEKEYAADQGGATYTSGLGYNSYALYRLLARVDQSKDEKLPKTHPPYMERLNTLQAFLKKNGFRDSQTANLQNLEKRFAAFK